MEINRNEVEDYLAGVRNAVNSGRYRISPRSKNRELHEDYVMSENKQREILLSLTTDDFSEAVQNEHPQHPEEILYIFGKQVSLYSRFYEGEETVSLYIKFNKLNNAFLIVISFHKQEYPLTYKFR